MSSFPGSPRLQKGAIVGIDPVMPVPTFVVFQSASSNIKMKFYQEGIEL